MIESGTASSSPENQLRLQMRGIAKRFGHTVALAGVDLDLRAGEIHALVGENGAGKSTLMKILSGAIRPDNGTMTLDGKAYTPGGAGDARKRGVAMVYQELTLVPHLSVEANLLLGIEPARWGWLDRAEGHRRAKEALAVLEHPEIHPAGTVADLSPASCQLVEIARALLLDVRVLVLDEPTSSLTQQDAERLFVLIRRLRDRGVTVVYISHFLEEVQQVADRVTVLRDGRSVGGGRVQDFSATQIVEMMVGRPVTEQFPRVPHAIGGRVLELTDLTGERAPAGVNLTLHRGEVLGLAGIVGAGRTELLRALFGLDPVRRGLVKIAGVSAPVRGSALPRSRIAAGLGFLSEDRKQEGLALGRSIEDNLTYTRMRPYVSAGLLRLGERRRRVTDWLRRLNVRCLGPQQSVGALSGGNQQKVAIGRLLHQQADVLLLDEPTRGVDVGSKAEIYRLIGELAAQGKAVLFVSSYLAELLGVCDRVAVMSRGRIRASRPASEWTPQEVITCATGQ
jgi:ribose transport system ATP-binding protein